MAKNTDKILAFEYLVYRLIEWYKNSVSSTTEVLPSHFSRLSILKLLFLAAAVKNDKIEDLNNQDLLGTFDRFCAMQYGPVEIDVYTAIVNDTTQLYRFGNKSIELKSTDNNIFNRLSDTIRLSIETAINLLCAKNPNIIRYNASQLVNITHKWQSWQNAMWLADIAGNRQCPMPTESIRKDVQYYGKN